MKWPWVLADCALNLAVRQRKNVLPSVYRSVKPHHLQLNYSQFMKKREESSYSLKDSLLQQKMLCILPNVQESLGCKMASRLISVKHTQCLTLGLLCSETIQWTYLLGSISYQSRDKKPLPDLPVYFSRMPQYPGCSQLI